MAGVEDFFTPIQNLPLYRINKYKDPLWASGGNQPPGRFHDVGDGATQYLSCHPLGPYPELIRVAERGVGRDLQADDPEFADVTYHHWTLLLTAEAVFELKYASAHYLQLTPTELVADDQVACRRAAQRMRADPAFPKVWRYPSAGLPGVDNVVIFGARAMAEYIKPAVSAIDVPGSLSAANARPPRELLPHLRHINSQHAGLDAYLAGDAYNWPQALSFSYPG